MLLVSSEEELVDYATKRDWKQDQSGQFFVFRQEEKKEDLHFIRNSELVCQALGYARELEKIV